MSITQTVAKFAGAGLLAAMLAGSAAAQDRESGWQGWGMGHMMRGWGMGHMMGGWGGGPMMGFGPDAMLDRIEGRLAFLKTELKITEAQSSAWDAMATTIRTNAEAHNGLMRAMMEDMHNGDFFKKPLPERLALQQSHMEARLEQIKEMKKSVDELYGVLDDTQKKAADEIVLATMGMGMGMGMGGYMMNR